MLGQLLAYSILSRHGIPQRNIDSVKGVVIGATLKFGAAMPRKAVVDVVGS